VTPGGRVYSNNYNKQGIAKELAQAECKWGYLRVQHAKLPSVLVHRLVAMAYIPNPLGLPEINHLDGNKKNNTVANLEWTTGKNNVRHAWATGLCGPRIGAANSNARLTPEVVQALRAARPLRRGQRKALAVRYGVCEATISRAANGRSWSEQ
jgi:hypothetical protein